MRKMKNYEIYKLTTDQLTKTEGKKITVVPLELSYKEALENGQIVKIQQNQLTNQILERYYEQGISGVAGNKYFLNLIVNITVPPELSKRGEKQYESIAAKGFYLNGNHYVRIASGSGQIRRNTITFIREDLYEPVLNALMCGLTFEDFGDGFNPAKFSAYLGLSMSGVHLLPDALFPRVAVVDDFEGVRPSTVVNHVTERNVRYITLPDSDYVLEDRQNEFDIDNTTATCKSDGAVFTIRKGVQKIITQEPYDKIDGSPCINSFDGQGLMSPDWAAAVAKHLKIDYTPAELIIRAPWVKGLLASVPFHEYFAERGITTITDAFGKARNIDDIDVILSKSQFKMFKIYKAKCDAMGVNAWDYHAQAMIDNHLRWGVARVSKNKDDDEKSLNYQYLQALQLTPAEINSLCAKTEDFLRKLNQADIEAIYQNLVVNKNQFVEEHPADTDEETEDYKKLFQKVLEANPDFVNDAHVKYLILKECESKIKGAKLGKLIVRGNFQFCVSDPLAQLQWVEKHHCGSECSVVGCVPEGHIYSNYWLDAEERPEEVVLMRSPLIDRNEIAKRKLVLEKNSLFRYLNSGLVFSIHDLTALQEGGCDFDGDIIFSTNEPIIANGCYSYEVAKPLYYALDNTAKVGSITQASLIQADIRGLNSKVGQISNRGASLYAMLAQYPENSKEYAKIYDGVVALGQIVGMEIDRIKTGIAPTFPLEWAEIQLTSTQNRTLHDNSYQYEDTLSSSSEEIDGILRHNELVPDTKPYFFRYNYDYLDHDIQTLNKAFNTESTTMLRKKLADVINDCRNGIGTETEKEMYRKYMGAYPVLDASCVVNQICHYFEDFARQIDKEVHVDGENMLIYFVKRTDFPEVECARIRRMIQSYKKYRSIATKKINSRNVDNLRQLRKSSSEALKLMRIFYREQIYTTMGNDAQAAFDILVLMAGSDEKLVWEILDDDIVKLIKKGTEA